MVEALAPQLSGIGRYSWELARRLPQNPAIETLRYRLPGRWVEDPAYLVEGRLLARRPWFRRMAPRPIRTWLNRRELRGSLVHGPNYFLPVEAETGIVTIHDLSVFTFPKAHPAVRVAQFERQFRKSLDKAAHFITDTATIRDELIAFAGISADMVSVVPLGVSEAYHPRSVESLNSLFRRYGLEGGYGLCVSALEPRKRIDRLIQAWSSLPRALRDHRPLVLAGVKGWLNDDLHQRIERGRVEGWLHFLDFVSEADLPELYAGAGLFVYPSIYEGFGLPPIEAMASGVPVIVSNRSCLPETCGDAALYIDPDDHAGFLETLVCGLTDEAWRKAAIDRGLVRASRYGWQRCADETALVYQKLWRDLNSASVR